MEGIEARSRRSAAVRVRIMDTTPLAPILQLERVTRYFRQGEKEVVVLTGVDAVLWPGQAVALVGPSGAGKSTLLHITGLLESPTGGRVIINGRDCATLSE